MSTLKTKKVQLGDNADPSKNFLIEVPAVADGTLSIKRQDGTNVLSIDATGKAVIPGVVGTVAQVGGLPTGQVVERGSNANGEYVRFADGTQICVAAVTFVGNGNWTYPSTFASAPVVAPVNSSGAATAFSITVTIAVNTTSASLRSLDVTSGSVATRISTLTPLVSAIGRWF